MLLEPLALHCLDLHVTSIGTRAAPMVLQGVFLRSKHVVMSAQKDIHIVLPAADLGWDRVLIQSSGWPNLTFVDACLCGQSSQLLFPVHDP